MVSSSQFLGRSSKQVLELLSLTWHPEGCSQGIRSRQALHAFNPELSWHSAFVSAHVLRGRQSGMQARHPSEHRFAAGKQPLLPLRPRALVATAPPAPPAGHPAPEGLFSTIVTPSPGIYVLPTWTFRHQAVATEALCWWAGQEPTNGRQADMSPFGTFVVYAMLTRSLRSPAPSAL